MTELTDDTSKGKAQPFAFPQGEACGSISVTYGGMTLRDWFAGQALIGITSSDERLKNLMLKGCNVVECSAASAYEFADAMLAARGDA